MKPHILRVRQGFAHWLISDGRNTLKSGRSATLHGAVARWEALYGRPAGGYTRVLGYNQPAHAAEFVANLARQLPPVCSACGCTDDDCRQCVEATGHACTWVTGQFPPICSRCHAELAARHTARIRPFDLVGAAATVPAGEGGGHHG